MARKKKREKGGDLEEVLGRLQGKYGADSVDMFNSIDTSVESVPTGSLSLDIALGVGGYPKGRIIEIYGPEASGKTSLTLHAVAECQKRGGRCAFIDAEHALDPTYAASIGVNVDELIFSQPKSGEEALNIVEELVESGHVQMVVVDSVAALVPKAELDGEVGDVHVGLQARMMSQALRKLPNKAKLSNCIVFFINQIRQKIGVMFGSPETTSGGKALKFYSSQRIDIRRIGTLKKGEDSFGCRTRVKVAKNKVAPPFQQCEFDIIFGKGISRAGEVLDFSELLGLVQRKGAWYSYDGEQIAQGRDNAILFLEENPETMNVLEKIIYKEKGIVKPDETTEVGHD